LLAPNKTSEKKSNGTNQTSAKYMFENEKKIIVGWIVPQKSIHVGWIKLSVST
jgi:hypothetical protein